MPEPAMTASRPISTLALWFVLGVLLAYAVAGALFSLVPASLVASRLGSTSGAGNAADQVALIYPQLVARGRATSAVLLAVWVVLAWRRHWLATVLGDAAHAFARGIAAAPARLARATQQAWRLHRAETLLALLICASGFAIRVAYLGRDLRHDEAWTYMVYAHRPVLVNLLVLSDVNHHPLNTLLIQLCTALFGDSVPVIRLPAFLFGIGAIPAAYALARALAGPAAALVAAGLVAGCTPLIEYSVNARGYSGVTFCALLALWAGYSDLLRPRPATVVTLVLAFVAGTYTNVVMVLPGVAAFVWFGLLALALPVPRRGPALRRVVYAGLAVVAGTLVLYLPFFTVGGWGVIANSQGIKARASAAELIAGLPVLMWDLLSNWGRDVWPAAAAAAAICALGSAMLPGPARRPCALLLAGLAAAVLFQGVIVRDYGPERVWLPFAAALLVLAGIGLASLLRIIAAPSWVPAVLAVGLAAFTALAVTRSATLLTSVETGYFPSARQVAHELLGMGAEDVLAITAVRGDEVQYYAAREGMRLRPTQTATLRYFRPETAPSHGLPGVITIVIDKVLKFCTIDECLRGVQTDTPFADPVQVRHDGSDYYEARARRGDRPVAQ